MKKEVNLMVLYAVLGVFLVAVIFIGYRMLGSPGYRNTTAGGEDIQKKFKETGTFYQPPAGVVPNTGGTGPGSAMGMPPGMTAPGTAGGVPGGPMGGYNLNPPPR